MIKKFEKFKSGDLYDYGCVFINCNIPNWNNLLDKISNDDLYKSDDPTYGKESNPHCTILYGLKPNVPESTIKSTLSNIKKNELNIKANKIDCFENEDFDVVKINIESKLLHKINSMLLSLPHKIFFDKYIPHITIAYVKPGLGKKYLNPDYKCEIKNINNIIYTKTDGTTIKIPLI